MIKYINKLIYNKDEIINIEEPFNQTVLTIYCLDMNQEIHVCFIGFEKGKSLISMNLYCTQKVKIGLRGN